MKDAKLTPVLAVALRAAEGLSAGREVSQAACGQIYI